jgi:hypothetical protein
LGGPKIYLTREGLRTLLARTGFGEVWTERWTSPQSKMTRMTCMRPFWVLDRKDAIETRLAARHLAQRNAGAP